MSEGNVRPTNVIANHKHYRYVRELWLVLNTEDKEQSEKERNNYEQTVIEGIRCYSKALITYIVKDILGYEIVGNYNSWTATNDYYCPISLEERNGFICLTISKNNIRFVTVANESKEKDENIKQGLYVLSLGSNKREGRIINISPYDADSVERVGRIIKEFILREYIESINATFEYPQMLKDYVKYIRSQYVIFENYTYSFIGIPPADISDTDAIRGLKNDDQFKRRNSHDKCEILLHMKNLVSDINDNADKILSLIKCQNNDCHLDFHRQDAKQLNFLQCSCGFVLDSTNRHVTLKNKDSRYEALNSSDWGMDYVDFYI